MKKKIIVLLIIAMLLSLTGCKKKKAYDSAVELMNQKNYQSALSTLEEISDYKDAADLIAQCKEEIKKQETYEDAEFAFGFEDYETAYQLFKELGDYEDAKSYYIKAVEKLIVSYSGKYEYKKVLDLLADEDVTQFKTAYYNIAESFAKYVEDFISKSNYDANNVENAKEIFILFNDGDNSKFTFIDDILANSDLFEKYNLSKDMIQQGYVKNIIGTLNTISSYNINADYDAIKTNIIDVVTALIPELESKYGSDEKTGKFVSGVKSFVEGLSIITDTSNSDKQKGSDLCAQGENDINEFVDDYNSYIKSVSDFANQAAIFYFSL